MRLSRSCFLFFLAALDPGSQAFVPASRGGGKLTTSFTSSTTSQLHQFSVFPPPNRPNGDNKWGGILSRDPGEDLVDSPSSSSSTTTSSENMKGDDEDVDKETNNDTPQVPRRKPTSNMTAESMLPYMVTTLDGEEMMLLELLQQRSQVVVFSCLSHFGDFNAWEMTQRYQTAIQTGLLPQESTVVLVGIGSVEAARKFADDLDITNDPNNRIILACDEAGIVARSLGCYQGWLATDPLHIQKYPQGDIDPYLKLLGMIVGFGSPGTMSQVIKGYTGEIFTGRRGREWVVNALMQGAAKGRFPELTPEDFSDVSPDSSLRPFELATLRLQTGLHIVQNWNIFKPTSNYLFTQMGGTFIFDNQECIYESFDQGILNYASTDEVSLVAEAAVNGKRWFPPTDKLLLKQEMKQMEKDREARLEQFRQELDEQNTKRIDSRHDNSAPKNSTEDDIETPDEISLPAIDDEEATRRKIEEENEKLELFNTEEVERRSAEEEAEKVSLFDQEEMERRQAEEEAEKIELFDTEEVERRKAEEEAEKLEIFHPEELERREVEEDNGKAKAFGQDEVDKDAVSIAVQMLMNGTKKEQERNQTSVENAWIKSFSQRQSRFFRSELRGLQAEEDEFLRIQDEADEALRFAEAALKEATSAGPSESNLDQEVVAQVEAFPEPVAVEESPDSSETRTESTPEPLEESRSTEDIAQKLRVTNELIQSLQEEVMRKEEEKRIQVLKKLFQVSAPDESFQRSLLEAQIQSSKKAQAKVEQVAKDVFQRRMLEDQLQFSKKAQAQAEQKSKDAFQRSMLEAQLQSSKKAQAAAELAGDDSSRRSIPESHVPAPAVADVSTSDFEKRVEKLREETQGTVESIQKQELTVEEDGNPRELDTQDVSEEAQAPIEELVINVPPPPPAYTTVSAPLMGPPQTDTIRTRNLMERRRRAFAQTVITSK